MDEDIAKAKGEALVSLLKKPDSLLVLFSGGVDSTFLLSMAYIALGEKVIAVTSTSVIHSSREGEIARELTRHKDIRHILFKSTEMDSPDFVANRADRCYHCKRLLFQNAFQIAEEQGCRHVAHGANMDDLNDYRPGFKAAGEAGAIAPLIEAKLTKEEIRFLSKDMGLAAWDTPSMSCLATRIPYESPITLKKLKMIEGAEEFLAKQGFIGTRVRVHGPVARIEVSGTELQGLVSERLRQSIVKEFRKLGFEHIALDLEGYISGKMNRGLTEGNM